MFATGMVDDVIIANAYASDEEMAACAAVNPSILTFGLELEKELTPLEQKILYYEPKHVGQVERIIYSLKSPRTTCLGS